MLDNCLFYSPTCLHMVIAVGKVSNFCSGEYFILAVGEKIEVKMNHSILSPLLQLFCQIIMKLLEIQAYAQMCSSMYFSHMK